MERDITFILSHPNGWGGSQQMKMKSAMELAGLIQNVRDGERITFVSEGEACLHYCINKQNESSWNGVQVIHSMSHHLHIHKLVPSDRRRRNYS